MPHMVIHNGKLGEIVEGVDLLLHPPMKGIAYDDGTLGYVRQGDKVTPLEQDALALYRAQQAEITALKAEINRMLQERSGGWNVPDDYPDQPPFELVIPGLEVLIRYGFDAMPADKRAELVGRVSRLLYRYMGDSPNAQATAIMKDLTGEPR